VSETFDALKLESVIPLESDKPDVETVRSMTTLSADTQKRNYPHYIVHLSPKREGMQFKNALRIARGEAKPSAA
jgi:hypothetical protein